MQTRLELVQESIVTALAFREDNNGIALFKFLLGKERPFGIKIKAVARNDVLETLQSPTEMRVVDLVLRHNDTALVEEQRLHHQGIEHARVVSNNNHRFLKVSRLDRP